MRFILNRVLLAFILDFPFALRLMRKLLKKQGFSPKLLIADKLRSRAFAFWRLELSCRERVWEPRQFGIISALWVWQCGVSVHLDKR
jgi:transposase-like protein